MIPAGGSRLPASCETVEARQHYMKMNGSEVYKFATKIVAQSAQRLLKRCGYSVADIDLFVPHQANLRIIEGAVKKLGIAEDKVYTNLQRYGNTSCASIPLCLSEARTKAGWRMETWYCSWVWCGTHLGCVSDGMGTGSETYQGSERYE